MIDKLIVPIGSLSLMIIYYTLGPIPLFCVVGGMIFGSLIETRRYNAS